MQPAPGPGPHCPFAAQGHPPTGLPPWELLPTPGPHQLADPAVVFPLFLSGMQGHQPNALLELLPEVLQQPRHLRKGMAPHNTICR